MTALATRWQRGFAAVEERGERDAELLRLDRSGTPYLCLQDWAGVSKTRVRVVDVTPKRFRIEPIVRTKLAGRNRWLEPGQTALVARATVVFF